MAESSTLLSAKHFEYVSKRMVQEDVFLGDLKAEARQAGIRPIWIAPEQAGFMQILLRLVQAKEVVEVGTLAGYSAICMARAIPVEGRVRTIEIDRNCVDFARRWIARSDAAEKIEVHHGGATDVLKTFETNSADAAFIDADKSSYPLYIRECLRIVRVGGLIMVDNAFAFGQLFDDHPTDPEVLAVRKFNDYMAGVDELQSMIVPLGDGCWVGVRLR